MKEGRKLKINFDKYASPKLEIKLPRAHYQYDYIFNCATAALSVITGKSPNSVQKQCPMKSKDGWYGRQMMKFLKNSGYTVVELTKNSVTGSTWWKDCPIKSDHLLLIVARMLPAEYSAVVIHKNVLWHNMDEEPLDSLYFLNKPTENVYLIHHKKWGNNISKHKNQTRVSLKYAMSTY